MKKLLRTKKKKKKKSYQIPPRAGGRKSIWLNVLPDDKWIKVKKGTTVYEALAPTEIDLDGECGGLGTCGKCKIRVLTPVGPPDEQERELLTSEDLTAGVRLACRTRLNKTLTVHTDVDSGEMELFQILKHGQVSAYELDPLMERRRASVPAPSIEQPTSDFYRLRAALGESYRDMKITYRCLSSLYEDLRRTDFTGNALVHRNCMLAWTPVDSLSGRHGIVFDIGTTTLVGKLIDLSDGLEISVVSRLNSQSRLGTNVISRMQYVKEKNRGLKRMREMLIRDLNLITRRLLEANGLAPEHLFVAIAAGNTTMQHFLLGLDPSGIAEAPFSPVLTEGISFRTADLGLAMHPEAMLYVMPCKSGYIGGDLISFILASGAAEEDRMILGLDFGTNGEIFLGNRHRMLTCSAAAGPALEGARISRGMIARAGAIESVQVTDDDLHYEVIGNIKARGLCGSGLVDLAAVLLHCGAIDTEGLLSPDGVNEAENLFRPRILWDEKKQSHDFFVATPEECYNEECVLLTQKDIRELQLAKSAVGAGVEILMAEMGVAPGDLDMIYLAGALGNYVNPYSAMRIGLIPTVDVEKVLSLGNAASAGAEMALMSKRNWEKAAQIVEHIDHVELSVHPQFYDRFIEAMNFPPENLW